MVNHKFNDQKEKLFLDQLKNIFIGQNIKGDSGFINLMKIKSAYFNSVFKDLKSEINEKIEPFPSFREELFDKLYTFFKTYFSESGSIYFSYTPLKSKISERVYSNNENVKLFWKTHMLYYVKTDKIWHDLVVSSGDHKICFDVSKLEHKKANEKKEIIYELKKIKGREIFFTVFYSERGRKTKNEEILKTFKKEGVSLDEIKLEEAFRIFKKQNDVDFFINKNAKIFLKEQFDNWIKNYLLDIESDFEEERIKQLKILKQVGYDLIDFVSQFEDELVKIWNKPKFVMNSDYVFTLDRIKENVNLLEEIIEEKGFIDQVKEWEELEILPRKKSDVPPPITSILTPKPCLEIL